MGMPTAPQKMFAGTVVLIKPAAAAALKFTVGIPTAPQKTFVGTLMLKKREAVALKFTVYQALRYVRGSLITAHFRSMDHQRYINHNPFQMELSIWAVMGCMMEQRCKSSVIQHGRVEA
jgi:hypothetical protein